MRDAADRFEGLAESYECHRPDYPVAAFLAPIGDVACAARVAVDLGAGPGNSTAVLRAALGPGWNILAIEPGRDMRRVLARRFAATPDVLIADATAEDMRLPDGFAALLTACTAFHWFDPTRFYAEAGRVLAPGGVMALIRNRRLPAPVVQAFDQYIQTHSVEVSDIAAREARKEPSLRDLERVPGFEAARSCTFGWSKGLSARGLIDLYLTRSTLWAVVRRRGLVQVMADLEAICAEHELGPEPVSFDWETTVKWVRKRPTDGK